MRGQASSEESEEEDRTRGMVLRPVRTHIAYDAMPYAVSRTRIAYVPMTSLRMLYAEGGVGEGNIGTTVLLAYACPMPCPAYATRPPVLTQRMVLPAVRYSHTERCAVRGRHTQLCDVRYWCTVCSYAMSGSGTPYAATRCP
eukprot:2226105-Rhodomonas_salina.1